MTKDVIRRYYSELFNQGRVELVDELLAPDYVNHSPGSPGQDRGREGVKAVVKWLRSEFEGLHYTIEDMVEGSDAIAVRTTVRGRKNGREFEVSQITIERFRDGKIIAHHRVTEAIA